MSDGKLKQNHVFVKNNVGSLALHKAKQEIGGIKMNINFTENELKHIRGVMNFRVADDNYLTEKMDKKIYSKADNCLKSKNVLRGRDD